MFGEIVLYLSTKASRDARRFGLVTQAIGLWSRSRRQKRDWSEHYQRCQGFIRAAIADDPVGGTAVILGSGLVADIPLDALVARFDRVILVDIVHLKPVRRMLGGDPRFSDKVVFDERDLTGRLALIHTDPFARSDPLLDLKQDPTVRLVVSANCLSQLPRPLATYLGQMSRLPDTEVDAICADVIRDHLGDLADFAARVILLTDTSYSQISAKGSAIERHDLVFGTPLPPADACWDWVVAPKGEIRGGVTNIHHVSAYADFEQRSR